jgi:hypothetical protein
LFINPGLEIRMIRPPEGEWIYLDSETRIGPRQDRDGIQHHRRPERLARCGLPVIIRGCCRAGLNERVALLATRQRICHLLSQALTLCNRSSAHVPTAGHPEVMLSGAATAITRRTPTSSAVPYAT